MDKDNQINSSSDLNQKQQKILAEKQQNQIFDDDTIKEARFNRKRQRKGKTDDN